MMAAAALQISLPPGFPQGSYTLTMLGALTVLSLAPSLLILMTAFTRIVIVLSFLRSALGTQNIPPNPVVVGLSLILTFFVMAPVFHQLDVQAITPYLAGKIGPQAALARGIVPVEGFMLRQTNSKDVALFLHLAHVAPPHTAAQTPFYIVVPAFVLSELQLGFEMGFVLYLPFMVIDMVVASTLMSMGMMMLPPVMISMPFKILLFVLVDGWGLVVTSLVQSFH